MNVLDREYLKAEAVVPEGEEVLLISPHELTILARGLREAVRFSDRNEFKYVMDATEDEAMIIYANIMDILRNA